MRTRASTKCVGFVRSRRRGSTLVEGLVAVFVSVTAALAFLPGFIASNKAIKTSQYLQTATQACRERIEEIRREGFQSLPDIADGQSVVYFENQTLNNLPGGVLRVKVTRVNASMAASGVETGRRRIDATATWRDNPERVALVSTLVVDVAR